MSTFYKSVTLNLSATVVPGTRTVPSFLQNTTETNSKCNGNNSVLVCTDSNTIEYYQEEVLLLYDDIVVITALRTMDNGRLILFGHCNETVINYYRIIIVSSSSSDGCVQIRRCKLPLSPNARLNSN